jgi:hypothetical protein
MKIVDDTLFAGLYGSFEPHPRIDPDADAYSLFVSRATAQRWLSFNAAAPSATYTRQGLWAMHDAGQDWTGQPARIAWYQVGVHPGRPLPIQPLLTCAEDSLTRVGTIDLQTVQLLLPIQATADAGPDLATAARQFLSANPETAHPIVVTLDSGESSEIPDRADEILTALTAIKRTGFDVHEARTIDDPAALHALTHRLLGQAPPIVDELWLGEGHHAITFTAILPEWSLDAIAWFAEAVVEACRRNSVQTTVLTTVGRP